ncbi:30S ribosomal protein S19 [Candidatus Pacearchaeota archaeon]|jgi:small subunit ribosomal protein S19|nr:30S ribosomal protein S19 [Candidatus Pacearchaeota archaeon]
MEIQKKQFTYRGKTLGELKKLDVREFANLVRARQKRNILRNFQVLEEFINRSKIKLKKNKPIRTHQRDLVIVPEMVGWKIFVYNGNKFISIQIIEEMLGHVLGEFAPTRGRVKHSKAGVGATKGTKHKSKK